MKLPGIIHTHDTASVGLDARQLRVMVRSGEVQRIGTWYATADADPRVLPFLAAGLRPTCIDGAVLHGLWTPMSRSTHAFQPRQRPNSTSPQTPRLVPITPSERIRARPVSPLPIVFHRPVLRSWPDLDPVPDITRILEHAARCLPIRDAAILFESALHLSALTAWDAETIIAALPRDRRDSLSRVCSEAESGTETAVRWWLESLHVPVVPQARIEGVGRVDLKVGRGWIIECDSMRFHGAEEQYHRDRARDLKLRALGYTVTRLTWEQVFLDWAETEQMLLAVIRRRDHRRRP